MLEDYELIDVVASLHTHLENTYDVLNVFNKQCRGHEVWELKDNPEYCRVSSYDRWLDPDTNLFLKALNWNLWEAYSLVKDITTIDMPDNLFFAAKIIIVEYWNYFLSEKTCIEDITRDCQLKHPDQPGYITDDECRYQTNKINTDIFFHFIERMEVICQLMSRLEVWLDILQKQRQQLLDEWFGDKTPQTLADLHKQLIAETSTKFGVNVLQAAIKCLLEGQTTAEDVCCMDKGVTRKNGQKLNSGYGEVLKLLTYFGYCEKISEGNRKPYIYELIVERKECLKNLLQF